MDALKALARFLLACFLVLGGFYFTISLAITFFLLTGRLQAGQPMYIDLETPTPGGLAMFQLVMGLLLGGAWWLRNRLRRSPRAAGAPRA